MGKFLCIRLPAAVRVWALAALTLVAPLSRAEAAAGNAAETYRQWILDVRSPQMPPAAAQLLEDAGLQMIERLPLPRYNWVHAVTLLPMKPADMEALLAPIKDWVRVQPNYRYRPLRAAPTDPSFAVQWGLRNLAQTIPYHEDFGDSTDPNPTEDRGVIGFDVGALGAWDNGVGSSETIVAVVDTGLDLGQPDMTGVAYTNLDESADGADNDGNGLIDDINGYDFCDNDADVNDDIGHGTSVAGVIAANADNNIGGVGLAYGVKILPLRVLGGFRNDNGDCNQTTAVVKAIEYARAHGARVVNMSLGGTEDDPSLRTVLQDAAADNILLVVATGNDGRNLDDTSFNMYPAEYDIGNLIAVAAHTNDGQVASFSNYGVKTVPIAAPGHAIYGPLPLQADWFPAVNFNDAAAGELVDGPIGQTDFQIVSSAGANRWGIFSLLDGSGKVVVLDAVTANANPNSGEAGYSANAGGTLQSNCVAVNASASTRLQFFAQWDLSAGDSVFVEASASNGASWIVIDELRDSGVQEVVYNLQTYTGAFSSICVRFRPSVTVGRTKGLSGGFWLADVRLTHPVSTVGEATLPDNGLFEGTSLASPFVAAAAALILSTQPGLPASVVKQRILSLSSSVNTSARIENSRRLDAAKATALKPLLFYLGSGSFGTDAVDPDSGSALADDRIRMKVLYVDPELSALPMTAEAVWQLPDQTELILAMEAESGDAITGWIYTANTSFSKTGGYRYAFRFFDSLGNPVPGDPALEQTYDVVEPPTPGGCSGCDCTGAICEFPEQSDAAGGCSCSISDARGPGGGILIEALAVVLGLVWIRRRRKPLHDQAV